MRLVTRRSQQGGHGLRQRLGREQAREAPSRIRSPAVVAAAAGDKLEDAPDGPGRGVPDLAARVARRAEEQGEALPGEGGERGRGGPLEDGAEGERGRLAEAPVGLADVLSDEAHDVVAQIGV